MEPFTSTKKLCKCIKDTIEKLDISVALELSDVPQWVTISCHKCDGVFSAGGSTDSSVRDYLSKFAAVHEARFFFVRNKQYNTMSGVTMLENLNCLLTKLTMWIGTNSCTTIKLYICDNLSKDLMGIHPHVEHEFYSKITAFGAHYEFINTFEESRLGPLLAKTISLRNLLLSFPDSDKCLELDQQSRRSQVGDLFSYIAFNCRRLRTLHVNLLNYKYFQRDASQMLESLSRGRAPIVDLCITGISFIDNPISTPETSCGFENLKCLWLTVCGANASLSNLSRNFPQLESLVVERNFIYEMQDFINLPNLRQIRFPKLNDEDYHFVGREADYYADLITIIKTSPNLQLLEFHATDFTSEMFGAVIKAAKRLHNETFQFYVELPPAAQRNIQALIDAYLSEPQNTVRNFEIIFAQLPITKRADRFELSM
jgi:hypothetical protein